MTPMSFFTSRRERNLWLWILLIVVTIYATLGLMPSLSGYLRDQGLLTVAFVSGMLLIGTAILTRGLKVRPKRSRDHCYSGCYGCLPADVHAHGKPGGAHPPDGVRRGGDFYP